MMRVDSALDGVLVGAALCASIGYAMLALGPRSWRRNLLELAALWVARAPAAVPGRARLARRLEAAAAKSAGCGGCDSCASNTAAKAGAPAATAAPTVRSGGDVRIPVGSIGRRR